MAFLLIIINYIMKFTYSLKSNSDFNNVYKNGKFRAQQYFVMHVLDNNLDYNRLGISVSKKVGNSVVRHRIKRLVKECYRINEDNFLKGVDIVVVARKGSDKVNFSIVDKSIGFLGKRMGIIISGI